jgi:hypothetical protein
MANGARPEFESEFPGHVSHQYPPPANAPAAASYKWQPTGPSVVSPVQFGAPGIGGGAGAGSAALQTLTQAGKQAQQQGGGGGGGWTVPTEADVQEAWFRGHPSTAAQHPWTPPEGPAGGKVPSAPAAGGSAGEGVAAAAGDTGGSFMGGLFGLE